VPVQLRKKIKKLTIFSKAESLMQTIKDLNLLGLKVQDKITGYIGYVTTISYDLYGCVQCVVTSPTFENAKGEIKPGRWFDTKRLKVLEQTPVMAVPNFYSAADVPGGYEKPLFPVLPLPIR
jgi:hypothetical protein